MDALIMACGTGGGHNGAAYALKEELEKRGHTAEFLDPYTLINDHLGDNVGGAYISMVRRAPLVFAILYEAGEIYRRLPIRSPVYAFNKRMKDPLRRYLAEHHYDVIFSPHPFPAMAVEAIKEDGAPVPPSIYIATDYTCIPFTEEGGCDYCVIPSARLVDDFIGKGIPPKSIKPFGIPVRAEFSEERPREELCEQLGLNPEKHYVLLVGGSMGAGKLSRVIPKLRKYLRVHPNHILIVICGTNKQLYRRLTRKYRGNDQVILQEVTEQMGAYMHVCDAVLTKPGGLSSTEAAVSNTPMIFVSPIHGCETRNLKFFSVLGLGVNLVNHRWRIGRTLELLSDPEYREQMIRMQREEINPHSARDICDLAETLVPHASEQ